MAEPQDKPQWIIGIDPGFEWLGFAQILIPGGEVVAIEPMDEPDESKKGKGHWFERSQFMAEKVYSRAQRTNLDRTLIFVEDAAHDARYGSEPLARLRQAIFEVFSRRAGVMCRDMPIKKAKKALTGNGNAKKEQVAEIAARLVKGVYPDFPSKNQKIRFAMGDALSVAMGGLTLYQEGKWTETARSVE